MKIAVTGATGHIGANVAPALFKAGHTVRALYRTPAHVKAIDGLPVESMRGDILDVGFLDRAFKGMDAVVHLAGVISIDGDPEGEVMRTNVRGTQRVVKACLDNGIRRLVHFSSIDMIDYSKELPVVDESTPLVGDDAFAYRVSKRKGEEEAWKGAAAGLEVIALRPTAVLGPLDFFVSAGGQMLRDIFSNALPALIDAGFDWVDVRDVAAAVVAALESPRTDEAYILSGRWASTTELSQICRQVSGRRTPRLTLPLWTAYLGLPFLRLHSRLAGKPPLYTRETLHLLGNCSRNCAHAKARRHLGYAPRPLEETIRDTYRWYLESGALGRS